MKMSAETYAEILDGIRQIVDYHGKEKTLAAYEGKSVTSMMFDLFTALWHDKQFEDTHPAYVRGRHRVLPYVRHSWLHDLYNSGLNDSHIETALKKVSNELGLVPTTVQALVIPGREHA